jgi:hypothetical protein
MQSSPDAPNLAGLKLQASVHGNIAVKALPIRLLALCTAIKSPHIRIDRVMFPVFGLLQRTKEPVNRFAA